ncbi:unnamed protein product, partial [Polarella glacialis]
ALRYELALGLAEVAALLVALRSRHQRHRSAKQAAVQSQLSASQLRTLETETREAAEALKFEESERLRAAEVAEWQSSLRQAREFLAAEEQQLAEATMSLSLEAETAQDEAAAVR